MMRETEISSQSPPYTVPLRYMTFGVLCFGLFALDMTSQTPSLAVGNPGSASVVAAAHLLTLGSLLSFVMGAVYQLSTVAFLIPLASVRIARWNFWLYAMSFVGLWVTMSQWWELGFLVFGGALILAIYLYAGMVLVSLRSVKKKDSLWSFIASAHAYLILAVSVAILLVLTDSGTTPGLNPWMNQLIATHIILAVGGFFTLLLMGFSYKLFPMFTLAHGYRVHWYRPTLLLAHISILLAIAGIWSHIDGITYSGMAVGTGAFVFHALSLRDMFIHRMRKRPEPPMQAARWALLAGVLGLGLLAFVQWLHPDEQAGWQSIVILYLLGCVTLTVMAYAYKILPFLIWSHRSRHDPGAGKSATIADLLNVRQSQPVFLSFGAGVLLFTVGSGLMWQWITWTGTVVTAVAILIFCVQMVLVLTKLKEEKSS